MFNLQISKRIRDFLNVIVPVFRAFSLVYKQQPWFYTLFAISIVLSSLFPIAIAYFLAKVIDSLTEYTLTGGSSLSALYFFIGGYFLLLLFSRLSGAFSNYLEVLAHLRISGFITQLLAKRYSSLDLESYDDSETKDLIQKVEENSHRIENIVNRVFWVIYDLVSFFTSIAILIGVSPIILVLIIIGNMPVLINNLNLGTKVWSIWGAEAETRRNFWQTRYYLQSNRYLLEIKVNGLRTFLLKKFSKLYNDFLSKQEKLEKQRLFSTSLVEAISAVFYILSYGILISKVLTGIVTIGLFTFYNSRIQGISGSLTRLFTFISKIYEDGLFIKDFFVLMDLKSNLKTGNKKVDTFPNAPLIEFKNVWFKYPGTKKYIFKNLNLRIDPGEHWAIVGENGAGKTTLVKLLLRYYNTTKGELLVNGKSIEEVNPDDWYKYIAPLMQEFATYHYDVETNIKLGNIRKNPKPKLIESAARLSGAHEFVKGYDFKYKQVLDRSFPNGISPSVGQWQKIALARAFYKDSPILILDEPTSAIDSKAEYEIFQKLFDFAKNKTVIIISHRFSTVRNADRIIVLDGGKIVEEGSHSELIKKKGMYKEAYDLQKKGYEDV